MEDYRVENEENKNREQENQVTNEKPPTAGKPKKKVKKVNVKVSDHADQMDNEAVPEKSGNNLGDTLFILDLMRQRKEKLMRQKKDEKINEMAMKQKQQKLEARQGMRVLTRPSFGGFVGKLFKYTWLYYYNTQLVEIFSEGAFVLLYSLVWQNTK